MITNLTRSVLIAIISAGLSCSAGDTGYNSPGVKLASEMHAARLARLQARAQARKQVLENHKNDTMKINTLSKEKDTALKQYEQEKQAKEKLQLENASNKDKLASTTTELLKKTISEQIAAQIGKTAEERLNQRYEDIKKKIPAKIIDDAIYSTIEVGFMQYKGYCRKRLGEANITHILDGINSDSKPAEYIQAKLDAINTAANEYAQKLIEEYNDVMTNELKTLTGNNEKTIEAIIGKYVANLNEEEDAGEKAQKEDHIKADDINANLVDE